MYTYGAFVSGGAIITLGPANNSGNESATVEIKPAGAPVSAYAPAHPFTRFDGNNLATSFFVLNDGVTYDLRITVTDPDSSPTTTTVVDQLTTKPEFVMPAENCTTTVNPGDSLQAAVDGTAHGGQVCVNPGTYGPISITNRIASSTNPQPLIIRGTDPNNKPVIDGNLSGTSVFINDSSHIYLDGFEIINAATGSSSGRGVYLRVSSDSVVRNNTIHANGRWGILANRSFQFPSGNGHSGGGHLIEYNDIYDQGNQLQFDNNNLQGGHVPGEGTVVRYNNIHDNTTSGNPDNTKLCGDETSARGTPESEPHVLALTSSAGNWTLHDIDYYGNTLSNGSDDNLEIDGMCVNVRIFDNVISGTVRNPLTYAPGMPGPVFVVRNVIDATPSSEGMFKMNTGGASGNIASRNLYVYHNTFVRRANGPLLNLWYGVFGDHDVPIKDYVFKNNIFYAPNGGRATDVNIGGNWIENPQFDNNQWFTLPQSAMFEWWDGSKFSFDDFGSFQAATGEESNGQFGDPQLDGAYRPLAGSPVIDNAAFIPGINDNYNGLAPDIGAFESSGTPPPPECRDGQDNDNDGLIDFPADPGCTDMNDDDETDPPPPLAQCEDGIDNDSDGQINFPNDPGCSSLSDNREEDCPFPDDVTLLDDTLNGQQLIGACYTLTTGLSLTVAAGADVTFLAGERVTLGSGLVVGLGASFVVEIDPDLP